MFFKKEKIENKIFEKSNEKAYHDLIYILGSKREIIKRNLLRRNSARCRNSE